MSLGEEGTKPAGGALPARTGPGGRGQVRSGSSNRVRTLRRVVLEQPPPRATNRADPVQGGEPSSRGSTAQRPGGPAARRQSRRIAVSFEEFYEQHQLAWVRYAHAHIGSRDAAEQIVDSLTLCLAEAWDSIYNQEAAGRHAWKKLKISISLWRNEHEVPSSFVETAAFERTARAMADSREAFAMMEGSLGLFSAMLTLPERQYNAIVMRFVLGYSDFEIASFMGVAVSTVRSNVRYGKQRLAKELGIHTPAEEED